MHIWLGAMVVLWVGGILVLMAWDAYLTLQMLNHRLPADRPFFGGRKFAFQTDPADYNETGKVYRQKSIKVEAALLAWGVGIWIILAIIYGK